MQKIVCAFVVQKYGKDQLSVIYYCQVARK